MTAADAARAAGPWRHPAFLGTLAAAAAAGVAIALGWEAVAARLTSFELALAGLLPESWLEGASWLVLPALGLGAGLLASVSPCVLPLVPLNAAFIGAADASGWRAASLSARFVLGAALALAVLGLAADAAGFLLIEQRGPVLIGAGLLMLYLGLAALELAPVPFAGRTAGGTALGPVAAGAAFSLVTTPCASPLLGAVLAAAAAQQVPGLAAVSMLGFALGYTALVFVAGVFGGAAVRRLRQRSFEAPRAAAAALLLVAGTGFALAGVAWF